MTFNNILTGWFSKNKRDLPWRNNASPYSIWLSEILLQQTRVAQGTPYYYRFIEKFPTLSDLAKAKEDEVLKLWQGLGYYSRARNMLRCAQYIQNNLKGKFPEEYAELVKLPGIGPYTAAAIASMAFNKKVPAIDGNVYRVISRYLGIAIPVNTPPGKKAIEESLSVLFITDKPGDLNQAMMELGAMVCTPKKPACLECPLNQSCIAFDKKLTTELPRKLAKKAAENRYLIRFCIEKDGKIALYQRDTSSIWAGLYDFPGLELNNEKEWNTYVRQNSAELNGTVLTWDKAPATFVHLLSHRKLNVHIIRCRAEKDKSFPWKYYSEEDLEKTPMTRLVTRYLQLNPFS
jgi:A/G-specific adenine glycosylase